MFYNLFDITFHQNGKLKAVFPYNVDDHHNQYFYQGEGRGRGVGGCEGGCEGGCPEE